MSGNPELTSSGSQDEQVRGFSKAVPFIGSYVLVVGEGSYPDDPAFFYPTLIKRTPFIFHAQRSLN